MRLAASQRGLRRRPAMFTHLSNTHTVCLPPERGSPGLGSLHQHISNMLRTAFSDLLQPTDAVLRQKRKTGRRSGDVRKPRLTHILPHFLISGFTHLHFISPALMSSPTTFYSPCPCEREKKSQLWDSLQVPHNQIVDLMKGFNYLLLSTGGVRLLFLLFIFLAIYRCPASMTVCVCVCF